MQDDTFSLYLDREKKLLVSSEDYGRDLTGVQNLKKKHKRLEAELAAHDPAIQVWIKHWPSNDGLRQLFKGPGLSINVYTGISLYQINNWQVLDECLCKLWVKSQNGIEEKEQFMNLTPLLFTMKMAFKRLLNGCMHMQGYGLCAGRVD